MAWGVVRLVEALTLTPSQLVSATISNWASMLAAEAAGLGLITEPCILWDVRLFALVPGNGCSRQDGAQEVLFRSTPPTCCTVYRVLPRFSGGAWMCRLSIRFGEFRQGHLLPEHLHLIQLSLKVPELLGTGGACRLLPKALAVAATPAGCLVCTPSHRRQAGFRRN